MAKGIYVGVNNVAKKVKSLYIGVNGVARKVKKAYIGVGGVAKQFYSSGTPTTSTVSFQLNSDFNNGAMTLNGTAVDILKDGTRPTMEITTSSINGFKRTSDRPSNYTAVTSVTVSTIYDDFDKINNVMRKTSSSSNTTYVFFRNSTSGSAQYSIKTFKFDFKKPRTLTLKHRYVGKNSSTFYGSNDNINWDMISAIQSDGSRTIDVNTPYRYYKLVTENFREHQQYYLYFENVSDTAY